MTAELANPSPLRVVVIDDDPLVCKFLGQILQSADIQVVAEGRDGDEAVTLAQRHQPDVIIMDIRMERMDGIDATKEVKKMATPPAVILMTSFDTEPAIMDSIAAGVAGFLGKDFAPAELINAVRQVASGNAALSPRATKVMLKDYQRSAKLAQTRQAKRLLATLTDRERAVAIANAGGASNAKIAELLHVSEATVKTQIASAMQKMQVENRVLLAVAVATAQVD